MTTSTSRPGPATPPSPSPTGYAFRPGATLWDHACNAPLRDLGRRPDLLWPGDRVQILERDERDSARALDRRLQYYAKVSLLILDEVGYLAFDSRNADLLFQVISRRYERKSLVLTTNLAFNDWPTIFPSATCATALIDRVIHHANVIAIEGLSYRLREAEARTAARTKPPKSKEPQQPPPKKK